MPHGNPSPPEDRCGSLIQQRCALTMAFWSWSKVIPRLSVRDTRHSWRKGDCVADFQTGVKAHEGDSEAGFAGKAVLGETKVRPNVGHRRADLVKGQWVSAGLQLLPPCILNTTAHSVSLFFAHEVNGQALAPASGHSVYLTQCRATYFGGHPHL